VIKVWNPADRGEFETLLQEVCEQADGTGERCAVMDRLVSDAQQAHRDWAYDVERQARLIGYAFEIKGWLKRNRKVVAIGGRKIRKPSVIGTQRADGNGGVIDYQLPFVTLTFEELRKKRREYMQQIQAYNDNVALMDKLLALEEMAPATGTPKEAARHIGIDLDDYLAGAA
jgi:hypothetical protein